MASKHVKEITLLGDYSDAPAGVVVPAKLVMRPPKAKDTRNAQQLADNDADVEILLLANLCEVTQDTVLELEVVDYDALQNAYTSFRLGNHLQAPKKPGKPV